jgi:hypothetical protein
VLVALARRALLLGFGSQPAINGASSNGDSTAAAIPLLRHVPDRPLLHFCSIRAT